MNNQKKASLILVILVSVIIISCNSSDSNGGKGVEKYNTYVEDNNPIPKKTEEIEISDAKGTNEKTNNNENTVEETSESSKKTIKIGFLYQKTGPLKMIAEAMKRGFIIGMEFITQNTMSIGDYDIKIIERDTEGKVDKAKEALEDLYNNEKVLLAIGSTSNEVTRELVGIADNYSKILIVEPAYADDITGEHWNKHIFKTSPNIYQRATALALSIDYTQNDAKVIVLTEKSNSGSIAFTAINKVLKEKKAKLVKHYQIDTEEQKLTLNPDLPGNQSKYDFNTHLDDIKKDIETQKATHLLIFWDINDRSPTITEEFSPATLLIKEWLSEANIQLVTEIPPIPILKSLGNAEGVIGSSYFYYTLFDWDETKELVKRSKEKYNIATPDSYMCGGFNVASVLGFLLEKVGDNLDTDNLIKNLEGKMIKTPKGFVKFRKEDHQALQEMLCVRLTSSTESDVNWATPQLYSNGFLSVNDTVPPINKK